VLGVFFRVLALVVLGVSCGGRLALLGQLLLGGGCVYSVLHLPVDEPTHGRDGLACAHIVEDEKTVLVRALLFQVFKRAFLMCLKFHIVPYYSVLSNGKQNFSREQKSWFINNNTRQLHNTI